MNPTFALNDLKHHCTRFRSSRGFKRVEIVVRNGNETRRHRLECLVILWLSGCSEGRESATVKRILGGDDLIGAIPVESPVFAGQLQRALVCLGAAIREKYAIGARVFNENFGELELRSRVVEVRRVNQGLSLASDRLDHGRMAVTEDVYRESGNHIQIAVPSLVKDTRALSPYQNDWLTVERSHIVLLLK